MAPVVFLCIFKDAIPLIKWTLKNTTLREDEMDTCFTAAIYL